MKQGTPLKRTGMKRTQPKRDWTEARAKVDAEGRCRLADEACPTTTGCDCGDVCEQECFGPLQAAHIVGREHDPTYGLPKGPGWLYVRPESVIPLCLNHHQRFDRHTVDVLPALTLDEQVCAVQDAGSIQSALRRTAPLVYRDTFRGEAVGGANSQDSVSSQYQGEAR